jgi:hypothetical protein
MRGTSEPRRGRRPTVERKLKEKVMSETYTMTIKKSIGYSGKHSGKSYIAKITGTHKQYIFAREFLDTECTDKDEMFSARRKRKGSWTEAAAVEPGLYERCEYGDKAHHMVWLEGGVVTCTEITADRVQQIAILMDDGQTLEEARIATEPAHTEIPTT